MGDVKEATAPKEFGGLITLKLNFSDDKPKFFVESGIVYGDIYQAVGSTDPDFTLKLDPMFLPEPPCGCFKDFHEMDHPGIKEKETIQLGLDYKYLYPMKKPIYENLRGFINKRLGRELLPKEVDRSSLQFGTNANEHRSVIAEVLRGEHGDGEIKIRLVKIDAANFSKTWVDIEYIVISAKGEIYMENDDEPRKELGKISTEDAAGLIAAIYGKSELGETAAPSDDHIQGIKILLELSPFSMSFPSMW